MTPTWCGLAPERGDQVLADVEGTAVALVAGGE
jgi:hypothetical protein